MANLPFMGQGEKVLVVRFSSIGDIVLTSPVLRGLHQSGYVVHGLTKQSYAFLFESYPYVQKVHTIQQQVREVLPDLKKEGYQYVVDLHQNLRSWQVRWALGGRHFSFPKRNLRKWLLTNLKVRWMPIEHIVDRYLMAAAPLGVVYDGQGLDYFIPPETSPPEDMPSEGSFIAFAIGATHATKRMPAELMDAFCGLCSRPIVLLGGEDMQRTGEWLADRHLNVTDYCGKISLHQSSYLVRKSGVVLTHDTGMMHIAAAFRKPIVSVWGNTVPDFGMYPFLPETAPMDIRMEVEGLSCRPCSKIGFSECPKGHFRCMRSLSAAALTASVEEQFPNRS